MGLSRPDKPKTLPGSHVSRFSASSVGSFFSHGIRGGSRLNRAGEPEILHRRQQKRRRSREQNRGKSLFRWRFRQASGATRAILVACGKLLLTNEEESRNTAAKFFENGSCGLWKTCPQSHITQAQAVSHLFQLSMLIDRVQAAVVALSGKSCSVEVDAVL
jgi:hypothetical protein